MYFACMHCNALEYPCFHNEHTYNDLQHISLDKLEHFVSCIIICVTFNKNSGVCDVLFWTVYL